MAFKIDVIAIHNPPNSRILGQCVHEWMGVSNTNPSPRLIP